jgi:Spy/CpxP family protein refolding chaperone
MKKLFAFFAVLGLWLARAAAAPEGLEAEIFPPEFLNAHREAIGLSEAQIQAIGATVQEAEASFQQHKSQLDDRAKALQEVLRQPQPEAAQAEEKLRALLAQENEIKVAHLRIMLKVRSQLTAEQLTKARAVRDQLVAQAASESEVRERLQKKLQQLRTAVEARATGGQVPQEIVDRAGQIQQLLRDGKVPEAERQLDELLGQVTGEKPKS